ncbi:hypothetical protein JOF53_002658 [Crossiella equi]|uniref:Phytoene synthase n=1 Tax=Crossiella equi TaxID=130796 RepID=A0ABS5AB38_9PSEU|nr:hypothetical protein [Crossiella equi]MBP2473786.1 hypothetical protein [Crossiella equi]
MSTNHMASLAALKERMLPKQTPARWQDLSVSYRESVKASKALLRDTVGGAYALGFDRDRWELMQPFIRHYTAVMYRGDYLYEAAQRQGSATITDHSWRTELEELVDSYGVLTPEVRAGLADLERYFITEGRIVLGEVELSQRVIEDVLSIRSSDVFTLDRLLYLLSGQEVDEEYLAMLRPWTLLMELRVDIDDYAGDVADDSFNTIRLFHRLHGPERALAEVEDFRRRWVRRCLDQLQGARTSTLRKLLLSGLPDAGIDVLAPLARRLPRAVLLPLAKSTAARSDIATAPLPALLPDPAAPRLLSVAG